jgi:hypothetical protein
LVDHEFLARVALMTDGSETRYRVDLYIRLYYNVYIHFVVT